MRVSLGVLLCVGLAACTAYEASAPRTVAGVCEVKPYDPIQGNRISPELEERARMMTGATVVRVIRPGQAITRDYDQGRLNMQLDSDDVVVRAYCG